MLNIVSKTGMAGGLALGLLVYAAGTQAAPAAAEGGYIGVGVGRSDFHTGAGELNGSLASSGITATSTSVDDKGTGWKLFGGYRFNENLAVEGAYVDLGKLTFSSIITAPSSGTLTGEVKMKEGIYIDVVGMLPLNDMFSVYGKLGVYSMKTEISASLTGGGSASDSARNSDATIGVGGEIKFADNLAARAEWERFSKVGDSNKTGQGDVDLWSVNMLFRF